MLDGILFDYSSLVTVAEDDFALAKYLAAKNGASSNFSFENPISFGMYYDSILRKGGMVKDVFGDFGIDYSPGEKKFDSYMKSFRNSHYLNIHPGLEVQLKRLWEESSPIVLGDKKRRRMGIVSIREKQGVHQALKNMQFMNFFDNVVTLNDFERKGRISYVNLRKKAIEEALKINGGENFVYVTNKIESLAAVDNIKEKEKFKIDTVGVSWGGGNLSILQNGSKGKNGVIKFSSFVDQSYKLFDAIKKFS